MNTIQTVCAVFLLILFFVWLFYKPVWSMFDHTGWNAGAIPNRNATVKDMKSERVKYLRNGAKFKTVVTFSDGFWYMTHKTNRKNGFMKYTISVDRELKLQILEKAVAAHREAVVKVAS